MTTVVDEIAKALGYNEPIDGLLGSGYERGIAYMRATDIAKAIGLPPDMDVQTVRQWGSGFSAP